MALKKLCYQHFAVFVNIWLTNYSHLFNKRGALNKRGGGAKVAKSLNVEGGIFWKKLVHNSNQQGIEGGKNLRNQ